MIVFKSIFKILNHEKAMLILYTVLLLSITLLNQQSTSPMTDFEMEKPSIVLINHDKDDSVTDDFISYLQQHTNVKNIDILDKEAIADAIFYRDVHASIEIPEHFSTDFLQNKHPYITYQASSSAYSTYSKMIVENYLKAMYLYKDTYQGQELLDKVHQVVDMDVKVVVKSRLDTSSLSNATKYFNFLNYAFLAGCVYCVSIILSSVQNDKVKRRMLVSSFPSAKYQRIVFSTCAIIAFLMWLFYLLLSFCLFPNTMLSLNGMWYVINSFVFAICGVTIGFLIGTITQNKGAINGIVNVVALGSSFLCGCFVPMEYMPSSVLHFAKVLPSYYFVQNNALIQTTEVFSSTILRTLFVHLLIMLLFSILFAIITKLVYRKKQTRE